jgi:CRISPR type I-D-associated protein Csc1
MGVFMEVYLAKLETHDFFFFVTRELKLGVTERYINNTALLYALNNLSEVNRVLSDNRPHYEEDWRKFSIYATPARIQEFKEAVKISYNSVDESIIFKMEDEGVKRTFPKYGAYHRFPPKTEFIFYTIGGKGPGVVRVGKKSCPCRVRYKKLKIEAINKGKFRATHPVNPRHMPADLFIIDGLEVPIPPIRIFDNVLAEGEYIKASYGNKTHFIAIPDRKLFKRVFNDNS